ncbi:uncharacterized protein vgf [Aulostomus maculatus]
MIGIRGASSALTLVVLLTGTSSFLQPSTPNPVEAPGDVPYPHWATPAGTVLPGEWEGREEEERLIQKRVKENVEEPEDELFKDVDPKTLAAVLLEALNRTQDKRKREGEEVMDEEMKAYQGVRTMEGADRDRDRRQKLELLMAAQGKAQQRQEAEERRKAQEEEERMTERVTSKTTSQAVLVQTQQPPGVDGKQVEEQSATSQGPSSSEQSTKVEEQLNPEELKSLETVMKEFPRLNTAAKREWDLEPSQRVSRGYSSFNDINKDSSSSLVMSKKKLKWQEETQKALSIPSFRGGNFMDEFEDGNIPGGNTVQDAMEGDEPVEEEEEEDEEELSPEEEEAQAKAEQEEMRRQAAEAQRAKMEEEKLADIASDMLLRYMVKQNNGNRKYSSSLSNAAEDKRSDEEQEVTEEEEEDIDPQTIDKLIEISSKLHLPADDVVDIISDVEKKKKKDVPPEMMSHWQQPLKPMSAALSADDFSKSQTTQNSLPVSKQLSPAVNLLKTWFQEKPQTRPQDIWTNAADPVLANPKIWPKSQKSPSMKQDPWLKSPKSLWSGYVPYPYASYYQRKLYPDYYPLYISPPPRPKLRYYVPQPALTISNFLRNPGDVGYAFPPKQSYRSWVQPRLRQPPPGLLQKSYYTSYPLPVYSRRYPLLPVPKPPSPPRRPLISPQQTLFYQPPDSSKRQLEKYIQQILLKRPQLLD